jgi:hypothetical protein
VAFAIEWTQQEMVMRKTMLAATILAALMAAAPAAAQDQSLPTGAELPKVGTPIYSSDGEKLGQVTQVGMAAGQPAVRAEIGGFLGVEQSTVVIAANALQQKPDRVELAMTAAEVGETLSKQKQEQQRPQSQ